MTYTISESERQNILVQHGMSEDPSLIRETLANCKITPDGKWILFESNFYSTETGDLMPLTEKWTLSDTLHTIGDVASMAADFVIPGSGAIIDAINGASYFIESLFQNDPKKRQGLYIMGGITFAFALVPGVLQAYSIPLKQVIKGTGKMTPKGAMGILMVQKHMRSILSGIPRILKKALNSKLGLKMIKPGPRAKLLSKLDNILLAIKNTFDDLAVKVGKQLKSSNAKKAAKVAGKKGSKTTAWDMAKTAWKFRKKRTMVRAFSRVARGQTPIITKNGKVILRKAGFGPLRTYAHMSKNGKVSKIVIKEIDDVGVTFFTKSPTGAKMTTKQPITEFINSTIGAPWMRKGKSRWIPLFVKRFGSMINPEGTDADPALIAAAPSLDPSQASMESLAWLRDDLDADTDVANVGTQPANKATKTYQVALQLLGYNLPNGADGKYGSETRSALKQFQTDAQLEQTSGNMDRLTAQQLALELKARGVKRSEGVQNALKSI